MQVLTKVETSLKFHQILLRSEAKNFTEVAALACRGENPFANNYFLIYPAASPKCREITPDSVCRSAAGPRKEMH